MLYSEKIRDAANIAYKAHAGQSDDGGYPYIMHPVCVAEQMRTENETIVALLHDILARTDVTLDELRGKFPEEVIEAIDAVTHRPDETREEYIERITKNPIATNVKIIDLKHNMMESRLCVNPQSDPVAATKATDIVARYKSELDALTGSLCSWRK